MKYKIGLRQKWIPRQYQSSLYECTMNVVARIVEDALEIRDWTDEDYVEISNQPWYFDKLSYGTISADNTWTLAVIKIKSKNDALVTEVFVNDNEELKTMLEDYYRK